MDLALMFLERYHKDADEHASTEVGTTVDPLLGNDREISRNAVAVTQ
jgi:hypothetical protein